MKSKENFNSILPVSFRTVLTWWMFPSVQFYKINHLISKLSHDIIFLSISDSFGSAACTFVYCFVNL